MKCAVSDFDRTLYVNEDISRENLHAVANWQAAGNLFIVATGRDGASIREKLREYDLKPDRLILNNGAIILDQDGKELFCRTLAPDTAIRVLLYLDGMGDEGSGVTTRCEKVNILSAKGTTSQKAGTRYLTMKEIGTLKDIVQIHRRRPEDEGGISALCCELNRLFPDISAYANVCNADIVAAGVDKSAAIEWIENREGGFDEILVIGDSANDIKMVRKYKGAAPDHASPEVQEAASVVVKDVAEYLNAHL